MTNSKVPYLGIPFGASGLRNGLFPTRKIASFACRMGINLNYLFNPLTACARKEPIRLVHRSGSGRRDMIKGMFFAPVVSSTCAPADDPSKHLGVSPEIWGRFEDWMTHRHRWNQASQEPEAIDSEIQRMLEELLLMEREIRESEPATLADVMICVLVDTSFGAFDVSEDILNEAVGICGLGDDPRAGA